MPVIKKRKTITDQFREMKVGGEIKFDSIDRSRPHAFARQAGISVETEIIKHLEDGMMRFRVTRIQKKV